jgi:hypothetical protein
VSQIIDAVLHFHWGSSRMMEGVKNTINFVSIVGIHIEILSGKLWSPSMQMRFS